MPQIVRPGPGVGAPLGSASPDGGGLGTPAGAKALLELAVQIGSSLEPTQVMRSILNEGLRLAGADRATLSSWDGGSLTIEASATVGGDAVRGWEGRSYRLPALERQPLIAEALATRRVVVGGAFDEGSAAPELRAGLASIRHTATVPILHRGDIAGLLVLSRRGDPPFSVAEAGELATLGVIAGLALRNARDHQVTADTLSRLDTAARTRAELLDIAVHELRSPLTVIQGYASLLEGGDLGPLGDQALRVVRIIATKAREAQEIATTLLTVARLETDELRVEEAELELLPLLSRLDERSRARLDLAGATLTVSCPDGMRVLGDESLVERIIDNLVNNAVSYSGPPAKVAVSVAGRRRVVEVRIADRGPAIAEEDRERIFERFVRGRGAERASGTGLGLYLSRECARRMGGDLVLEAAAPGAGNTFLLRLPAG